MLLMFGAFEYVTLILLNSNCVVISVMSFSPILLISFVEGLRGCWVGVVGLFVGFFC